MNLRKITFYIACLTIVFVSCKKDDDNTDVKVELNDRTEQQIVDKALLITYLETHYYNSDHVNSLKPNVRMSDLVIGKLKDGETDAPVGHTMLKKGDVYAVEIRDVVYAETDYEYYVLNVNAGGGSNSPTFADNTRVNYEGFDLADDVFDSSVNTTTFDLTTLITAWRRVLPTFNTALSADDNSDGTVNFVDPGIGVMFLPSGLAYFSGYVGENTYAPIIFKFELLNAWENDHDGDGVPSYLEDLNGDGEFIVNYSNLQDATDDDTDGDGYANYNDSDDDGDGISTINEDIDNDGDPTNDDSNKNGIPNYLDNTDKIKKSSS